jgi:hypothetical protein
VVWLDEMAGRWTLSRRSRLSRVAEKRSIIAFGEVAQVRGADSR